MRHSALHLFVFVCMFVCLFVCLLYWFVCLLGERNKNEREVYKCMPTYYKYTKYTFVYKYICKQRYIEVYIRVNLLLFLFHVCTLHVQYVSALFISCEFQVQG